MITIIAGTNRKGSNTLKVAQQYAAIFKEKGVDAQLISLERLKSLERNPDFEALENTLKQTTKFVFVVPEYNGSIPGIFKMLIDQSDIKTVWWGKKALLTGVSTGRAGNLRGMEHLTGILNYVKVVVHPNKLPISVVDKLLDGAGVITDTPTIAAINNQIDEFIQF
jgi:chromate reductase, NAD(P)H dehydrogenase (quinone)